MEPNLSNDRLNVDAQEIIQFLKTESPNEKFQLLTGSAIKKKKIYPRIDYLKDDKLYFLFKKLSITTENHQKFPVQNLDLKGKCIIFLDCNLPGTALTKHSSGDIIFYNCVVDGPLTINFGIMDNCFIDNSSIGNLRFTHTILKKLHLGNAQLNNLEVTGCCLDDIKIDSSKTGYVRLTNSSWKDWQSHNAEHVYIRIDQDCQLNILKLKHTSAKALEIIDARFSMFLENVTIPIIDMNNCLIMKFIIDSGTKSEINVKNGCINYFNLDKVIIPKETTISFINVSIFIIFLIDTMVLGQLLFKGLIPVKRCFETNRSSHIKCHTDKDLKYQEISMRIHEDRTALIKAQREAYNYLALDLNKKFPEGSHFEMTNSSLGKLEIIGSDLSDCKLRYMNTNFSEAFLSGTRMPDDISVKLEDSYMNFYMQKVEYFSQLKKIYDRQGDIIKVGITHAKILFNQELYLKNSLHKSWFKRLNYGNTYTYFTFWINNMSSKHGESWQQAAIFTFITSFAFFILFLLSLKYRISLPDVINAKGWCFLFDEELLAENIKYYFVFLNPARTMDFFTKTLNQYTHGLISYFLDFSSRIVVGYGIFQFIVAFRKHGRSN